MNRKRINSFVLTYLGVLFFLLLLAVGAALFLSPSEQWPVVIFFVAGFFFVSWLMRRWGNQMTEDLSFFKLALDDLKKGRMESPLPRSDIQNVWAAVTALHEAREELSRRLVQLEGEKEKLAKILANLREGILVADPGNRVLVVNESAGTLLKTKPSLLIGKSIDTLLTGKWKPLFEALIRGEDKTETLVLDSEATVLSRSFLLKNPDNSLIAKVCVLYDITESKRLDDMRKAFVANASHELRSPAAGLQALLDALLAGGLEEKEERVKFLGMMNREITRLNAIIRDLLDLSELEREKEFSKKPLNLAALFESWLETYKPQIREKKIQLETRFAEPKPAILGSEEDIEKLFRNLLENAIKYTPSGGSLEIGLSRADGELLGWVKDSGFGIPKEHQARIFERFYRVDQSRSRALGGTGLGLSIAKHAVERHGGKIWVESEEGHGCTFFFKIPLG